MLGSNLSLPILVFQQTKPLGGSDTTREQLETQVLITGVFSHSNPWQRDSISRQRPNLDNRGAWWRSQADELQADNRNKHKHLQQPFSREALWAYLAVNTNTSPFKLLLTAPAGFVSIHLRVVVAVIGVAIAIAGWKTKRWQLNHPPSEVLQSAAATQHVTSPSWV